MSALNMFAWEDAPQQPPPPQQYYQPPPQQQQHHHRQAIRSLPPQGQDASRVSPIFFGYDVQPPHHQPHHQPQHQPMPQQQPSQQRRLPASMGFSAGPMQHVMRESGQREDVRLMQNMSYYQMQQRDASLDGIDNSLFNNFDAQIEEPRPQDQIQMYMTDQYGHESMVATTPSSMYRLLRS